MTRAEIAYRAGEKIAIARERVDYATGRTRWDRRRLEGQLRRDDPRLAAAGTALRAQDWSSAHSVLREYLLARPSRFPIDPADSGRIARIVGTRFPSAREDAMGRADSITARRYDLLGYRELSFRGSREDPDWHFDPVHGRRAPSGFWADLPYLDPGSGDHKVIWELNRHQHWLTLGRAAWLTGDRRYASATFDELERWLAANPPLTGINWSSMLELAFRSLSWIWALHLFLEIEDEARRPWIVDLLTGLQRQLDHVATHLSFYFSPNTHLLGEGLALYVAGRVLPELRPAARWERLGRTILLGEATAQINDDGGHAELSPHYHRYALDFYLLALVIARKTNDVFSQRCAQVVERLATFCRAMARDDGRLPTIGDDDGGLLFPMCGRSPADARDTLSLAACLLDRPQLAVGEPPEELVWMTGGTALKQQQPAGTAKSAVFQQTGYAVLRAAGDHAVFDGGPHGFLNGGHAHADALSIVLSLGGRPLLIDPGTATYTTDPRVRDRFRSTSMHNTLALDGLPQSVPNGPFHWKSRANGRIELTRTEGLLYAEASHDGYLPVIHRRAISRAPHDLWLVVDHVLGAGQHTVETFWHFAPEWSLSNGPDGAALAHRDGFEAAIATTASKVRQWAAGETDIAFSSPIYGQMVPSPTLTFEHAGKAPFSQITILGAGSKPGRLTVELLPVGVDADDGWHRAAFAIRKGGSSMLGLFATIAEPGTAKRRSIQRIAFNGAELTTDARVALLAFSPEGRPCAFHQIEATMAAWTGAGAFEIASARTAGDLHCDVNQLRQLSRRVDVHVG